MTHSVVPSVITGSSECILFLENSDIVVVLPRRKRIWKRHLFGSTVDIRAYLPVQILTEPEIQRLEAWWDNPTPIHDPDIDLIWEEIHPILQGIQTGTRPDWMNI